MSRLSRASHRPGLKVPMGLSRARLPVFLLVVLSVYGISQLSLSFSLSDLRLETNGLQNRKIALLSEVNRLKSQVEEAKRGERLIGYAGTELGMEETSPGDLEHLTLSARTVALFDGYLEQGKGLPAPNEIEPTWTRALVQGLSVGSEAIAGEKHR